MQTILISACLLGQKVRYDGHGKHQDHPRLTRWVQAGNVVSICPEVSGGLGTPRDAAEIQPHKTAEAVLKNSAKVMTTRGEDVTAQFIAGAKKTLALAKAHNIRVAILKARSPSCGSQHIYSGFFDGTHVPGMGVTAALLKENGIQVFNETQIDEALDAAMRIFSC